MHTPGPWTAELERNIPSEGLFVRVSAGPFEYDMTEEDARVAGAAPELLEALRDLAQLAEEYKVAAGHGSPILMASIARARAAIEKATK